MKFDFSELAKKWPSAIVARNEIKRFSGGLLTPRYLSNLDSRGEGPRRFRVGRKVCYYVQDVVEWLESRTVIL